MNEVNILNIGGIDYNIDDQLARDVIAHSENGLDSQSNLPVSSRHYDEGDYLIGQDRLYYEVTSDIEIGDVIAEDVNVRVTNISEELVRLKNQSSIAVIQSIAKVESTALSSRNYVIGKYFYWDFGLAAGLYETIATITSGDALSVGVNIKLADKMADTMDGLQDAYNITGAKNLCPNNAVDTVTTDITWDILSDGSIQVSGTAASNRGITLNSDGIPLPAGTYTITTGQANEANVDVILLAKKKSDNSIIARSNSYEYSATFTLAQATDVIFVLSTVHTGVAINARVFPMCRVASITDETYVPYAPTNRELSSQISDIANYSTSETNTGMKWIDGKQIYRKVVNFGALPNNGTKALAHGISNLDTIINLYGYIKSTNAGITTYLPISVPSPFGAQYSMLTSVDNTNVSISTGVDRTTHSAVVVLEYTKA